MFREGVGIDERIESLKKMGWTILDSKKSATIFMEKDISVKAGADIRVIHSRKQLSPRGDDRYVEYTH